MARLVFCNKKDRWKLDFRDGGKRKRLFFQTKSEALKKLSTLSANIPESLSEKQGSIAGMFRDYRDLKFSKKAPSTQKVEELHLKMFFEHLIKRGVDSTEKLTLKVLATFQDDLSRGREASSVNRIMNTIRGLVHFSYQHGFLSENVSSKLERLKEEPSERGVWTLEVQQKVIERLPDWAKDLTKFMLATGFRPGQAFALKFQDVDLECWTINTTSTKGRVIKKLTLPIRSEVVDIVRRRQAKKPFQKSSHVFVNSRGRPVTRECFGKVVRLVCQSLGVKVLPYELRHTFGSTLVNQGAGLIQVKALMGHSSVRTTERYLHTDDEVLRKTLEIGVS